jgi:iron complex transport system substrate-binding protein
MVGIGVKCEVRVRRVVSLIASATEIVCALGLEKWLVGRSHECDYPESIKNLPICTEPKIDVAGSSREIDQQVKSLVQDGLSVYRVHADVLKELRPDVILTQSHCDVCAVSQRDVDLVMREWIGSQPEVVSLAPNSLADVWTDIERVAQALGVAERGRDLVAQLQARIGPIVARARALPARRSVACIEWVEPLMAAGNWVPELVEMAGGENLFGQAGRHAPWMTWDQVRQSDPGVIVVLPCGLNLARCRAEMPALVRAPGWYDLRAVREERVFLTDGNQFFNRPGPRLVESLEILAELLHPQDFSFGHEGKGWERWKSGPRVAQRTQSREPSSAS